MSLEIEVQPKTFKFVSEYTTSYCTRLLEHMSTGHSLKSFGGRFGIARKTIDKWLEEHEEFAIAYELAESKNLLELETIALEIAKGDIKGNAGMLKFLMTNQHSDTYMDKQVVENQGGVVFQIDTGIRRNKEEDEEVEELEHDDIEDVEYEEVKEDEDIL